jgi:hypothetical protein
MSELVISGAESRSYGGLASSRLRLISSVDDRRDKLLYKDFQAGE